MNPISERDLGALADAVRRRHRSSGAPAETIDALERHTYRVATLVDDLAEGESLNALDYQVVRVAAALHDAARSRVRAAASASASAAFADDMLHAVGADPEFIEAVSQAIRRHGGERVLEDEPGATAPQPETYAEMILHDACLLAGMEEAATAGAVERLAHTCAAMRSETAARMAARVMDSVATHIAAVLP